MNVEENFFDENDKKVTKTAVKALRWLIFVYPVLIVLSLAGIFQAKIGELILLTAVGVVVTQGPGIAYKLHTPIHIMKYVTTFALAVLVALMATNAAIGIYMTYGFAMVFSLFYYDKKFTIRVSVVSYILLVLSLYFRSLNVPQIEYETNMMWFISRSIGFLMESVVMSLICVKIADLSHQMLVRFADTRQTVALMDECEKASGELSGVVEQLESCIHGFTDTNEKITGSVQATLQECQESSRFVDSVRDSIHGLNQNVDDVVDNMEQMMEISKETSDKLQHYMEMMHSTMDEIGEIEHSARQTESLVENLESGMNDISGFADTIAGIASQTNLLALNASIEAARAGEMGKGFSVVAEEVGVLAQNSKQASDAIAEIIQKIVALLEKVHVSNQENIANVTGGLEKLKKVEKEAERIGVLQEESKEKARVAANSGTDTKGHSEEVLHMVGQMENLVENTIAQAEQIADETQTQKSVAREVEESFRQVNEVSGSLLRISQAGREAQGTSE